VWPIVLAKGHEKSYFFRGFVHFWRYFREESMMILASSLDGENSSIGKGTRLIKLSFKGAENERSALILSDSLGFKYFRKTMAF